MKIVNQYFTASHTLLEITETVSSFEFQPTLAIAFVGPAYNFNQLREACRAQKIELVGCTGSGEIIDGQLKNDGAAVMFFDLPVDCFQVYEQILKSKKEEQACEQLGKHISDQHPSVGIFALCSGTTLDGAGVIRGLQEGAGVGVPIYGGLAGDYLKYQTTYTFTTTTSYESAIVAIAFDTDCLELNGTAVSGWQSVGKLHTATKVKDNLVQEIDGQPALDLFLDYFGPEGMKNLAIAEEYIDPTQIPLQLQSGYGEGTIRSILRYDTAERGLVMAGGLDAGDTFKFCPIAKFGVMQDTIKKISIEASSWRPPEAILFIQCYGRHYSFGPLLQDEIKEVFNVWNKPCIGFLSNGEFGPDPNTGKSTFHNITLSLMTIRER